MSYFTRILLFAYLSLSLAACSANHNTAYRMNPLPAGQSVVISMDAKQRSILSTIARKPDGTLDPAAARKFCSEPSPDVFSVIAQSLSGGGSFSKGADPASIQAALNLAYSSAEQGSTIPRTQTINMLRELMFNTCLRYMDGGIDKNQLAIQAIRDQRLMVSILAIEQLTGAVTPKPVVIGAAGSAAAGITGEALIRLDDARKAKESAEANFQTADAAYQTKNDGDKKVCDGLKGKKESDDGLSTEQKADIAPCDKLRKTREDALSEQNRTAAIYQELSMLARSGGVTAVTQVSSTAPGGIDRAATGNVKDVANAVQLIVAANMSDDTEIMLYCLSAMDQSSNPSIKAVCKEYVRAKVDRAAEDQKYAAEKQKAATAMLLGERDAAGKSFDRTTENRLSGLWQAYQGVFATKVQRDGLADQLKSKLVKANKGKADCFRGVDEQSKFTACFTDLRSQEQLELLKLLNK